MVTSQPDLAQIEKAPVAHHAQSSRAKKSDPLTRLSDLDHKRHVDGHFCRRQPVNRRARRKGVPIVTLQVAAKLGLWPHLR